MEDEEDAILFRFYIEMCKTPQGYFINALCCRRCLKNRHEEKNEQIKNVFMFCHKSQSHYVE